ncbi:MAG TPA: TadE/TadG family type IV pilus assembly protein [Burkholderiales bacterium]|nr:TadE/TadG family type IV pilus assembly protein [Burkholderiales bacterium]
MRRPLLGRAERGAAAVEFALLVIPLLVILVGITEFGRALYSYNTLAKAARDAARLMSTQAPGDPDYGALVARARCTAVYGNATCTGSPLVHGLALEMVSICDPASCPGTHAGVPLGTGVANLVTVTIGGAGSPFVYQSFAPFAPALFGIDSLAFGAIGVTLRQAL